MLGQVLTFVVRINGKTFIENQLKLAKQKRAPKTKQVFQALRQQ
jgi:hypothetical protein